MLNNDKALAWQAGHRLCITLLVIQIAQLFIVLAMAFWLHRSGLLSVPSILVLLLAFALQFVASLSTGYRLTRTLNQAACGLWDMKILGNTALSQLITILMVLLLQSLALLLI